MTEREQRLKNEVGQLTHTVQRLLKQRKEMQVDLVSQRDTMGTVIATLERGNIVTAIEMLQSALDHRDRTREKRKNGQKETA